MSDATDTGLVLAADGTQQLLDHRGRARLLAVHPPRHLGRLRAVGRSTLHQIGHKCGVEFLARFRFCIPFRQQRRGADHDRSEPVVVDALVHQHEHRDHEEGEDEGEQRQHQPEGAQPADEQRLRQFFLQRRAVGGQNQPGVGCVAHALTRMQSVNGMGRPRLGTARFSAYCASQAVKRSFNSSWLSAQNSKPLTRALLRFASAVGMCGPISVLPSLNRPTIGPDDLRAGP